MVVLGLPGCDFVNLKISEMKISKKLINYVGIASATAGSIAFLYAWYYLHAKVYYNWMLPF